MCPLGENGDFFGRFCDCFLSLRTFVRRKVFLTRKCLPLNIRVLWVRKASKGGEHALKHRPKELLRPVCWNKGESLGMDENLTSGAGSDQDQRPVVDMISVEGLVFDRRNEGQKMPGKVFGQSACKNQRFRGPNGHQE